MKPNFALSLSFSGIQLLQRQAAGWGRVGDIDLGTADLTGDLAALLDTARALGSGPVQTKLIIPDDQIKYLTVDASGLNKEELQSAVLVALDGATPYAVDELEFDFANHDGQVYVAAVAKETLQEAESFANEHGFDPIGFVAAPPAEKFPQEPNFGLSSFAKTHGITRLDTDGTPAIATGEAVAIEPETIAEPEPPKPEIQRAVVDAPPVEAAAHTPPEADSTPAATPGFSSRRATPAVGTPANGAMPAPPQLGGAERAPAAPTAPASSLPAATELPPIPPRAPKITGRSTVALDEEKLSPTLGALRPGAAADPDFPDDVPPMPAGFATAPRVGDLRGAADGAPAADLRAPGVADNLGTTAQDSQGQGKKAAAKAAALAGSAGGAAIAGMRSLLAKRAKAARPADAQPALDPVVQDQAQEEEKQRMTVFGARKPKKTAEPIQVGGKPRFLGLILTAILLLFLVSVAAWASVFLDDGLARFFGGADRTRAIAELPDPTADSVDEDELIELAALESGEQDFMPEELGITEDGLTQVTPVPPVMSPQEAEAKYAATGIWVATPVQPASPAPIALEDVYTASIDSSITGQDAFALEPLARARDAAPRGQGTPPPAGSQFAFDENGFVIATPEGAITPEGALVFLGRPARIPPEIPERLRTAALTPETAEPAVPQQEPVSTLRPKLRPEALVEKTERTQLGGNTLAELSKKRPKLRPKLEKEVAESEAATAPASALAVANSRKPSVRPNNFGRVVSRAQRQAETDPEQTATQVAAVAPKTVTPRIPSSASVAKNATVRNAINLSRVNLIGVYGKPSSRRALVRLSSGRYKKVKVGDRVDGGRVSAIGETQLVYTKSGRSVTLRMPKG